MRYLVKGITSMFFIGKSATSVVVEDKIEAVSKREAVEEFRLKGFHEVDEGKFVHANNCPIIWAEEIDEDDEDDLDDLDVKPKRKPRKKAIRKSKKL